MKALNRETPDVLPNFELIIDPKVREAILSGGSLEDFIEYMDIDAYMVFDKVGSWKFETLDVGQRIVTDQWGGLNQIYLRNCWPPIGVAIKSEKDLDQYIPPDPDKEWRYELLKKVIKRF